MALAASAPAPLAPRFPRALALIPAHDEAASLPTVVEELRRVCPGLEILVVDDASDDATPALLPALNVRWLRLGQRLGTGGAVRAGLRYARRLGFETVYRLDADGQHLADQVSVLDQALARADAAVGSRYQQPTDYRTPPARRLAQRLLAGSLSLLLRRKITDPTSGFWAFGPKAIALLADHHPPGYGEPELRLFLARNELQVAEVAVRMRERIAGRSSLTLPRACASLTKILLAMLVVPIRPREERRP